MQRRTRKVKYHLEPGENRNNQYLQSSVYIIGTDEVSEVSYVSYIISTEHSVIDAAFVLISQMRASQLLASTLLQNAMQETWV